jgi:hypothetical protein
MTFVEPLAVYFTDFAEDVTWSVGSATVQAIFDNEYQTALGVVSRTPGVKVQDSQIPGVANAQTLTIRGQLYKIVGVEPDGRGVTRLQLEKQ